jgi:magnesium transporter
MKAELKDHWKAQQYATHKQFALAADELSRLTLEDQAELLENLPEDQASAVFEFLDTAYQEQALQSVNRKRGLRLIETLQPDDKVRLLTEIPDALAKDFLSGLSASDRKMITKLLAYPPESAGRSMTPEFLSIRPGLTVGEVMAEIRSKGKTVETLYVLPIVGNDGGFVGIVHLRDLVMSESERRVEELVDPSIQPVLATEDQEKAARLIQTTDALAAPVVDDQGRLLGLVTVDDAMDILDREAEEDLARSGGAEPLNRPYFTVSILRLAKNRVIWLLMLSLAAVLTVNVLNFFEQTLEATVTLALFIPLLIGTGGNSGAQSVTTLVRAMSVGEVEPSDALRIVLRELSVGVLLGSMLAVISLIPVWFFAGARIAAVVALTLVLICAWASAVGGIVPLAAQRIGIDPAVASAPFITTLIDATGLIVYFLIARALLF